MKIFSLWTIKIPGFLLTGMPYQDGYRLKTHPTYSGIRIGGYFLDSGVTFRFCGAVQSFVHM